MDLNDEFQRFWRAHKQTFVLMIQPTSLQGISPEQYLENQLKKVAQIIHDQGCMVGRRTELQQAAVDLKALLSEGERPFVSPLSDEDVPAFINIHAN